MRKIVGLIGVAVASMMILCGCQGSSLAEGFEEAKVKEAAGEMFQAVCDGDYETFAAAATDTVKSAITEDAFQSQVVAYVKAKGEFEKVEKEVVVGTKENDEDLATDVMVAKFKEGKIQFKITFNKDMQLSGLWLG